MNLLLLLSFLFSLLASSAVSDIAYSVQSEDTAIPVPVIEKSKAPVIDGIWTNDNEWLLASETIDSYDNEGELIIRAMHDRDHIYVLIELPRDNVTGFCGAVGMACYDGDDAIICFDTKLDGGEPKEDDYCLTNPLLTEEEIFSRGGHSNVSEVYRGYGIAQDFLLDESLQIGKDTWQVSGMSRSIYSSDEHATYEFKINIESLGRANEYGFYVLVDDAEGENMQTPGRRYSWPPETYGNNNDSIADPSDWVLLFSPDNTMPEFSLALVAFTALFPIILLIRKHT